MIKNLQFRYI